MKAYTDLEQSKKLAEILPFESADMWYWEWPTAPKYNNYEHPMFHKGDDIVNVPCWSLAALLEIVPKCIEGSNRLRIDIDNVDFSIWYDDLNGYGVNDKLPDITLKEPVDACVEMILMLHKEGLL